MTVGSSTQKQLHWPASSSTHCSCVQSATASSGSNNSIYFQHREVDFQLQLIKCTQIYSYWLFLCDLHNIVLSFLLWMPSCFSTGNLSLSKNISNGASRSGDLDLYLDSITGVAAPSGHCMLELSLLNSSCCSYTAQLNCIALSLSCILLFCPLIDLFIYVRLHLQVTFYLKVPFFLFSRTYRPFVIYGFFVLVVYVEVICNSESSVTLCSRSVSSKPYRIISVSCFHFIIVLLVTGS